MKRKPEPQLQPGTRPAEPLAPEPAAETRCRRCGEPGPLSDDGFCCNCEKALEQACL